MRGARASVRAYGVIVGIIPAYAGSTSASSAPHWTAGDHPRVCGEHLETSRITLASKGSSPRMRGAHEAVASGRLTDRIIPAYAGSTGDGPYSQKCSQDHPRVCGEHNVNSLDGAFYEGSSPRMRGAPRQAHRTTYRVGIIPAYAGSTVMLPLAHRQSLDHPRVYGEHQ